MKARLLILSDKSMRDTYERMYAIVKQEEERRNRSIFRIMADVLKKPVWGKERNDGR